MTDINILTFNIKNKLFGIIADKIYEISAMKKITRIPNSPWFISGVIDYKGNIIPVIDTPKIFNLSDVDLGRIIILNIIKRIFGLVTGSNIDVIQVSESNIKKDWTDENELIAGILQYENHSFYILNIDNILTLTRLSDGNLRFKL